MGIDIQDMGLYLNIAFFSVLAIGFIFGLIKGFRRSLYTFIITLIFLAVFFLTVNTVVSWFYEAEISFLNNLYQQYLPVEGTPQSVRDIVHLMLQESAGEYFNASESSAQVIAFIDSLGTFILKIVYTILYFTVFQIIYRFLFFIIGLFIFAKGRAKNKKGKRSRPLGGVFGTLTAALNLFVMIIVLSGVISIAESLSSLDLIQGQEVSLTSQAKPKITDFNQSLNKVGRLQYNELAEADQQLNEALESLNGIIDAYNSNIIIQVVDSYKVEDEFTGEEKNMAIVLFDEVLSMNYKDQQIGIREDLKVFVSVANTYLSSDYYDSGNLNDIKSEEVTSIFTDLSKSKLLTSLIPVGIEVGVDSFDVDGFEIDDEFRELIYNDIDWQDEIQQLGGVVTAGIMILENANPTGEEIDYTTVPFDGDLTETMFTELSNSKLAEYGAFIAFDYVLTNNEDVGSVFITVPENIDWVKEFKAFGMIANEILSTGITVSDFENTEGQDLLLLFSGVDLTVLMESDLTTRALVNILSGKTNISLNIEFLKIPTLTDAEWLDTLDQDGDLLASGELRLILESLNIMVQYLEEIDFDNLDPAQLSSFTDSDIDNMFNSLILVASITEVIKTLDTGGIELIIPDSVLDNDGYITKTEVKTLFKSIKLIASETACDPDDDQCATEGFDIDKAFALEPNQIGQLFESEILYASSAKMLIDFEQLIVPEDVKETILVEANDVIIISREELISAFIAVGAMDISIDEELVFDESILLNLSKDPDNDPTTLDTSKTDKLFASKVLHATISDFLLKQANPTPPETSNIIIPYFSSENYEVPEGEDPTNLVIIEDAIGDVTYVSSYELVEILQAVLILDITDFSTIDDFDLGLIIENTDELLDSAILHATISDQLKNSSTSESLVVPSQDIDGFSIEITVGEDEEATTYIKKTELSAIFNSLDILGIEDLNNITVETLDFALIIDNIDDLLASAILHATISSEIFAQTDNEALVLPSLDLNNSPVIKNVDQTDYIVKAEISNTLQALQVFGIEDFDDFNTMTFDSSLIQKLSVDPITDPTSLDQNKSSKIFSSKIIHASLSKVLFDAGAPDEITGESDLIVPYVAAVNYTGTSSDLVRFVTDDGDEYIIEAELTELFKSVLALDIEDFNEVDTLFLSDILPHRNIIFNSAILQATISDKIIELGNDGNLTVPSLDLNNDLIIMSKGDVSKNQNTEYIDKDELINTLEALDALGINDFNNIEVDASIIKEMSVDPINDPTTLDESKADTVLSSKIVHATISQVLFDAGEPDEITGESDLIIPYVAASNYSSTSSSLVRFVSNDSDTYIIEEELTELFRAVLALDIADFNQVDSLFLSDILPHRFIIFNSAILQATISDKIIELGNDGNLTVPNLDLSNQEILTTKGDALLNEDTTYIIENELINTLEALDVLGINDFNNVEVDASIIKEMGTDADNTILDETKSNTVLSSKIVHATISQVLFDAGAPDEITGESDLIIPYVAAINYSSTSSDLVRFISNDSDTYIIEEELTELFRAVLALDIDDFNQVDSLLLSDILPHRNFIFNSAILQATISDKIIELGNDGDLTVPSLDLSNEEVLTTKGDTLLNEDTTYIIEDELINTLEALDVLGINDFNNVVVDASIIKEMGTDADNTVLDESKSATVLSSKIVHATISQVLFDAATPDEITGESDLIVPFEATEIYSSTSNAEVRFITSDTDTYIVEDELTELFRAVLALDIDDFGQVDTLLLSDIIPHKDFIFDSAIIHATISDKIIELGNDGDLTVPSLDLSNQEVLTTKGDALLEEDTDYVVKVELINTLLALQVLNINDFNNVEVDASIIKEMGTDADNTILDETKSNTVLSSKIVHATLTKIILDSNEPDELTGERDLIVPFIASEVYTDLTDEVRFVSNDSDKYIVELELTELFRAILALDIEDFNQVDSLLLSDIIPHKDFIFDSAIIHATISDKIIELGNDGDLTVPSLDLSNIDVTISKGDVLLEEDTDYIIKTELINTLLALQVLKINDFNNVLVTTAIIKEMGTDVDNTVLDETKSSTVLASKIVHATLSKIILDSNEPDEITGERDLIVPFIAASDYSDMTDEVRFVSNDLDKYIVELELTELFRAVLALDIEDFNQIDALLLDDIIPHKDYIFNSSIIHATISDTIIQLGVDGDLTVPSMDLNNDDITFIKGDILLEEDTEYILVDELKNTLDALKVLGIQDFNNVIIDAGILQNLSVDPINDPTTLDNLKKDTVLSSKIVHASLSNMIIDSGEPDEITGIRTLIVPFIAAVDYVDLTDEVRFVTSDSDKYIVEVELTEFFQAILALNIDDFNDVDTLTLQDIINNQDDLLDSAILHATISKQVLDLEVSNTSISIPEYNDAGQSITIIDNTDIGHVITYLQKDELTNFFASVNLLGDVTTIDSFNGTVSLDLFLKSNNPTTYEDNQDTLLASSIMQATISLKVSDLDVQGKVFIPSVTINEQAVEVTHATDYFIYKNELKALINVMDVVGLTSIESFGGDFTLSSFSTEASQNTLIASAIMHRTLSQQLLDNTSIIVPRESLEENLTSEDIHITTTIASEDYIIGDEIKALITVMNIISSPEASIDSISSDIDFSKFDEDLYPGNQDILLASAIMHASLSDEMISLNDDVLFVPKYSELSQTQTDQIRFDDVSGTDFIKKSEIKHILNAFLEMGYNDLSAFDNNPTLEPSKFFDNITLYLESASFHATISNKILAGTSPNLIIPSRDIDDTYDIKIVHAELTYVESNETIALVNALNELSISDFNSAISGSAMTSLTDGQLDTILTSGSMHLSIDDIIQANSNINTNIPDKALADIFALSDILIKDEVKNFILAAKAFSGEGSDIQSVDFTTLDMVTLSNMPEGQRTTILSSMIVRNILTPQVEQADTFDPTFTLTASDYEDGLTNTFLTLAGFNRYIAHIS
ncbi:hypothetical protein HF295_01790 [Hujiaoplasma nucleasis]|uniref:Uncharacterized protein n=1 Tax=Hujiaoplasma nucleasis TaxID=2725268 RepID=A0A7L6N077_9MOLU|nr:hypothetical protein [Hujiaoplasma nucleasis]QLY39660.1 hypothetical protein HF295_01790 [Hujiaoplasma nucleasis]